ncbi:MAG: DUF445 family protein [Candidatus Riflebacteria bacterium]|nr:DUF445 family protein [Candidatus Riflebacteria bacterium]
MWETIISLLVSMLIGGFIGWITNLLAVKALFHPHKSYRILGFDYQGLLPKRKAELANNLGNMVEGELINIPELIKKVKPEDVNPFIDKMVDDHKENIQKAIYDYINNYLKGIEIPLIKIDLTRIISTNTLVTKTTETVIKLLKTKAKEAVPTVLTKAGSEVIKHVSVHDIVKEKVDQMDLDKLEAMVNRIADKEMKMIEYLGGVLGLLVGAVQWLLQHFLLS